MPSRWNYLRVRGEYHWAYARAKSSSELPPRARRILFQLVFHKVHGGTTSAHAENTSRRVMCRGAGWNYLRARGEYLPLWWWPWGSRELPPRARRIPAQATGLTPVTELPPRARRILGATMKTAPTSGTTSVCAENTSIHLINPLPSGNYLRVRGEYVDWPYALSAAVELPPRARRILRGTRACDRTTGTTSACAENTLRNWPLDTQLRNYLRVRGEYADSNGPAITGVELPPRARRIPNRREH